MVLKAAVAAIVLSTNVLHASSAAVNLARDNTNLICQQRGWGTVADAYDTYAGGPFSNCYQWCQSGNGQTCKSMAVCESCESSQCLMFNVSASDNFVADDSSPYLFYDMECAQQRKQCGTAGYSKENSRYSSPADNLAACAAMCAAKNELYTTCFSYAYGTDGQCGIYERFVADNINVDNTSPYVFYDYLCKGGSGSIVSTSSAIPTDASTASSTATTDASSPNASPTDGSSINTNDPNDDNNDGDDGTDGWSDSDDGNDDSNNDD